MLHVTKTTLAAVPAQCLSRRTVRVTQPRHVRAQALRNETPEEALQRRMAESEVVDQRVTHVQNIEGLKAEMEQAGDKLIVVEVQADDICQLYADEEPELHWKADKDLRMEQCVNLKHVFQRTARSCPDVRFLEIHMTCPPSPQCKALCEHLKITTFPTLQFWRQGRLLWQHEGVMNSNQDLGEGVLYYGDHEREGTINELHSRAQFDDFIATQNGSSLAVVDVSLQHEAPPCIHVFPAVLALAKSFEGCCAFARLFGDESPETKALILDLKVVEVPTFVFYKDEKEVGRHVGSSRGDLIGKLLEVLSAQGIKPPPPPPRQKAPPKAKAKARR